MSEKDCAAIFGREGQHEGIEMRGKRFYFIGICIILLVATLLPLSSAYAADGVSGTKNVTVTLPSFFVSLNGQTLDNQYSKYPLLVYKDITYFPMTYYDCRLMGLKTEWDQQSGLSISKNNEPFYEYEREVTDRPNGTKQKAQLPDFNIQVDGKTIDNGTEEYPILLFRNVTYFPLTWQYAVNEFGWDYHFDSVKGLTVNAPDVVMGNPNQWEIQIGDSGFTLPGNYVEIAILQSIPGVPPNSLEIAVADLTKETNKEFHEEMIKEMNKIELSVYSTSDRPVKFDVPLEYQVYKKVGDKDELVYRLILPAINEERTTRSFWALDYPIDFWKESNHGTFLLKLVHPDTLQYQMLDTGEKRSIDFKDVVQRYYETDQCLVIM